MAVMRVHKNGNYTIMSNYHFKEREMSLKAKGLLSLMLSLPDDWDYSINGLATLSKDGRDSVMGALQELEKFGYLTRTRITNDKGHFKGYDYDIYEEPRTENPNTDSPNTAKPKSENRKQLITNQLITNELMTNEINDKKDKRNHKINDGLILEIEKPNGFTYELIRANYIEEDDLFISDFNNFFNEMVLKYDFEIIRSCVWYFAKQMKARENKDEFGNEIKSKLAYCKISIQNGANRFERIPDWLAN